MVPVPIFLATVRHDLNTVVFVLKEDGDIALFADSGQDLGLLERWPRKTAEQEIATSQDTPVRKISARTQRSGRCSLPKPGTARFEPVNEEMGALSGYKKSLIYPEIK